MTFKEPDQTTFDEYKAVISEVLWSFCSSLITGTGSVINELIIRPLAYVGAWLKQNTVDSLYQRSASYLKSSNSTDNVDADNLASNYFTTRKQGMHARGNLTFKLNTPLLQIPQYTVFSLGAYNFYTETGIVAADATYKVVDDTTYVPVLKYSEQEYLAFVPVVAQDEGMIELNKDTPVETVFDATTVNSISLSSAITGGSGTETDAELMSRLATSVSVTAVGSATGLEKKLQQSPIPVRGFKLIGGEDAIINRGRLNNININLGGFVDCYVKTQEQPSTELVTMHVTHAAPAKTHEIVVTDPAYAGLYRVQELYVNGVVLNSFDVQYSTEGTELGTNQLVTIKFNTDNALAELDVSFTAYYMPGLHALQTFIDSDENKFLGQDVLIRAAVPMMVHLDCVMKTAATGSTVNQDVIKKLMASCICSIPIGSGMLNFSDVRAAVQLNYPDVDLRLPCTMSVDMLMRDRSSGAFYSTNGVLDMRNLDAYQYWNPATLYFCAIPENIHLQVI